MKTANNRLNKAFLDQYRNHPGGRQFNCWGGTVMYFDPNQKPTWFGDYEMIDWLKENCEEVNRPGKNIICAIYDANTDELMHTAVCLDRTRVWHKMGGSIAEVTLRDKAVEHYAGVWSTNGKAKVRYFKVKTQFIKIEVVQAS